MPQSEPAAFLPAGWTVALVWLLAMIIDSRGRWSRHCPIGACRSPVLGWAANTTSWCSPPIPPPLSDRTDRLWPAHTELSQTSARE